MKQNGDGRARARAAWVYALLLRLYPRAHRQAFGDQMLQTFQDHYRDTVEMQGARALLFWLGVLGDAGMNLVREHRTALRERITSMRKSLVIGWAVGLPLTAIALGLLLFLSRSPVGAAIQRPMPGDSIGRALLSFALFWLTLGLYTALAVAMVLLARQVLRVGNRSGWVRLGLVLGGIFSLYIIITNALGTFLPSPDAGGNPIRFLLLTLPLLLTGVAGVIGGYGSGTIRRGVGAGLLTGLLGVLADQASEVLLAVLVWLAIQHHLGPAGIAGDYQHFIQNAGRAPDLGTFVSAEYLQDGFGFPIMTSLILLTIEGLCAALGGWIGASLRRADRSDGQPARPAAPTAGSARFLFLALVLGLLVWIATVEFDAVGGCASPARSRRRGEPPRQSGIWAVAARTARRARLRACRRPVHTRSAGGARRLSHQASLAAWPLLSI